MLPLIWRRKTCYVSHRAVSPLEYSSSDFPNKSINTFPGPPPITSQTAYIVHHLNYSYLAPDAFLCLSQLELNLLPFSSLFFQASDLAPVSAAAAAAFSSTSTKRCESLVQPCCSLVRKWSILFSAWKNSFCMAIWVANLRPWVALIEAMDHVLKPMLRIHRGWWRKTLALFCSPILHKSPRMVQSICLGQLLKGPYLYQNRRICWLQHLWRSWKHQMATDESPVYSISAESYLRPAPIKTYLWRS